MAKEIINEDFDVPEHFKEEEEDTGVEIEVVDDTPKKTEDEPGLSLMLTTKTK